MRQIFLDTETTGLSPEHGDRVVEIACVEMVRRKRTGHDWHCYVNPERDIHADALKVHGLTREFLQDKPMFADIAGKLVGYLRDANVIIHNAPFDVGFLNMELARLEQPPLSAVVAGITDTLLMAKELYPGKRHSLDALCDRLEVDRTGRILHGALLDAELLADVYLNLTRGQDALLMDSGITRGGVSGGCTLDLSHIVLPILTADDAEQHAHEDLLQQIDKSSGAKTVWRKLSSDTGLLRHV